jgi:hypothetical protein
MAHWVHFQKNDRPETDERRPQPERIGPASNPHRLDHCRLCAGDQRTRDRGELVANARHRSAAQRTSLALRDVHRVDGALHLLVGHIEPVRRGGQQSKLVLGFIQKGQVLRPSSSQPLVRIEGNRTIVAALAQHVSSVKMELCYGSILATCWNVGFPGEEPQALSKCPVRAAEQLHDVPPMTAGRKSI